MSDSWDAYYHAADASLPHFLGELNTHQRFILEVTRRKPQTALEVGCGPARISSFLSWLGLTVTAVDRDAGVLARAAAIASELRAQVRFIQADAFRLPFPDSSFDVSFHQGFLEHFADDQVEKLITEQLRVAHSVVFSVPNSNYPDREFGDERLLSRKQWERVLKPFHVTLSTNYYRPVRKLLGRIAWRKPAIMYLARIER